MFGSVLPSTAPHTEFVRPLPFELSLLMCFKSPLQFHIPEQLSCSKKLEIQRGLFLLFYPFVHQLRLTPTRLEKQSWVQPLVCRSMSSLWTLKPAGSFCLCPLSVPQPCPCSTESRFGSTSAPWSLWQSPLSHGAGERDGWGTPVPDAGRRRDEDPLSLPGYRRGVTRSCSPFRVQDEEGTEELQIWDCSSCFRGKKGESGKCPFCTVGILWSH